MCFILASKGFQYNNQATPNKYKNWLEKDS